MPAIERALTGEALRFHIAEELAATEDAEILARSGRTARTLIKDHSLRVTIHRLAAGGSIPEHHADGPITVHVLRGSMTLRAAGQDFDLHEGDLLALDTGVPHAVASAAGAAFLLTISLAAAASGRS